MFRRDPRVSEAYARLALIQPLNEAREQGGSRAPPSGIRIYGYRVHESNKAGFASEQLFRQVLLSDGKLEVRLIGG